MTEQGGIDMGLGKMYARGGVDMEKQMDLFNDKTELRDEGGEKDNASGNDVPLGGDKGLVERKPRPKHCLPKAPARASLGACS